MHTKIYILILAILVILMINNKTLAQQIYITKWKSEADAAIFETKWKSEADLVVYVSEWKSDADKKNNGIWHYTKWKSEGKQVYITSWKSEADIVVYYTKWKSEAGWVKKDKMNLLD